MSSAKENIAKCPDFCYSVDRVKRDVIKIKAGEMGAYRNEMYQPYRTTDLSYEKEMELLENFADNLNVKLGVTPAQRDAMEIGSMFGWEVPGANPDSHDEKEKAKKGL